MFRHYLKIAFRNLWNGGFHTIFTIVGLAVAFFCFGICAYFVHGLLTIDNYYENHDRVFEVRVLGDDYYTALPFDMTNPEDLKNRCPEVESFFRFTAHDAMQFKIEEDYSILEQDGKLSVNEQYKELNVIDCDTTLRQIYSPALLAGSWNTAMNSANSMLMTEHFARKLFGSADAAIGRMLTSSLSGKTFTVRAVVENLPPNNSINTFMPLGCWIMNSFSDRSYVGTRVLLRQGVSVTDFNEKLASMSFGDVRFKATPIHNKKTELGDSFNSIMLLILAPGLIVLLAALGNFLHLLVCSIFKRGREYTLRKVNGARTVDLWFMVSTQVLVTMLWVGLTTIVIIKFCTPMLHISLMGKVQFQFDMSSMLKQVFQHIGILLLVGLLVSWIATIRIRNNDIQSHLRTADGHHFWRNLMMGCQMIIGFLFVTLLCAMLLQMRQNVYSVYPGLSKTDTKNILFIPHNVSSDVRTKQLLDKLPSVSEYVYNRDLDGLLTRYRQGLCPSDEYGSGFINNCICSPGMLQFLGVKLLEGRWFNNAHEVMIDKQMAETLDLNVGDELLIDQTLGVEGGLKNVTITGIIENSRYLGRESHDVSTLGFSVFSYDSEPDQFGTYMVKCMPGKTNEVRNAIEKLFKDDSGHSTVEIPTLFDKLQIMNQVERQLMGIFWLFAAIALAVSLLGVYSAVTMETTVRRKEMAVRKINGAKTCQIAALLGRFYMWLLVISAAVAFPLTYFFFNWLKMSIWVQWFNYGPLFYLAVFLIVAAFVALTVSAQIQRIARIEPYTTMKSE